MKEYNQPTFQMIQLQKEDIICTSLTLVQSGKGEEIDFIDLFN